MGHLPAVAFDDALEIAAGEAVENGILLAGIPDKDKLAWVMRAHPPSSLLHVKETVEDGTGDNIGNVRMIDAMNKGSGRNHPP